MPVKPLPPEKLHATLDPGKIPWEDSAHIPVSSLTASAQKIFQPRAMRALELGLGINTQGYHIYLSGEVNLGRTYMLLNWLKPIAAKKSPPPDFLYVQNFSAPDAPALIKMEAGSGKIFRDEFIAILRKIRSEFINALSSDDLDTRQEAGGNGSLPSKQILPDGQSVDLKIKNKKETSSHLVEALSKILEEFFDPWKNQILNKYPEKELDAYLSELRIDFIKNIYLFLPDEKMDMADPDQEIFLAHYPINIFVDNYSGRGVPVIVEDHPTFANLLGCIERESEMGALVTDLSLIRAGSIHRANGGYLIIHAADLLQRPEVFEGLIRALRNNIAKIEDQPELSDLTVRTKGLRPENMRLNIKVILIGNEELYDYLLEADDRFGKLFKIKAQLAEQIPRTSKNIKHYLAQLALILKNEHLLGLDNSALAWLVELGSHLCEDQKKLSVKFPLIREILIESDARARMSKESLITSPILEKTFIDKNYRQNLLEEEFLEEYDRGQIRFPTSGKAIGQVNGLSIVWTGDFEFGLPQKISCTVGVGHEGIIDLEREADLGGPIHTKAMMILKSYLIERFAHKKPLVLSGSLYFEQSYAGIEGDSASGAELAALLSALAKVPVRLDLAFTGAVNHSGQILAVGGVTKKIEGFFKLCVKHGLTGTQGVIIPQTNIDHLMLSSDILTAARNKKFHIYPVNDIEEAMYLLTGMKTGKRKKNGKFTSNSLYDLVDKRLDELGYYAQTAFRKKLSTDSK